VDRLHIKRMICSDFHLYSYIKIGRPIIDARQRPWWQKRRRKESRHSRWLRRAPPDRLQTLSPSSYLSLSLTGGARQGQPTLILSPPASNSTEVEALGGFGQGVDAQRRRPWVDLGRAWTPQCLSSPIHVCVYIYIYS
jgi:hypothetical protein